VYCLCYHCLVKNSKEKKSYYREGNMHITRKNYNSESTTCIKKMEKRQNTISIIENFHTYI